MATKYIELSDKRYDEISARVRKSYPNSCIVWIEENQNDTLLSLYETHKEQVRQIIGHEPKEQQLFHGTREESVNSILTVGFDPAYNKTSAYGIGSYFARDARYSYGYMHPGKEDVSYMFLADVITERQTSGVGYRTIPSSYDCAVDTPNNPSIFVTPHHYGAYPRYIIAFHKSAQ